jgi:hypothetical protein
MRAKAKAHQNPSTENPGVNSAASKTTTALMTNKNSPKSDQTDWERQQDE